MTNVVTPGFAVTYIRSTGEHTLYEKQSQSHCVHAEDHPLTMNILFITDCRESGWYDSLGSPAVANWSRTTATADDCEALCQAEADCAYFTFRNSDSACHLKGAGAGPWVAEDGHTSGPKLCAGADCTLSLLLLSTVLSCIHRVLHLEYPTSSVSCLNVEILCS